MDKDKGPDEEAEEENPSVHSFLENLLTALLVLEYLLFTALVS